MRPDARDSYPEPWTRARRRSADLGSIVLEIVRRSTGWLLRAKAAVCLYKAICEALCIAWSSQVCARNEAPKPDDDYLKLANGTAGEAVPEFLLQYQL